MGCIPNIFKLIIISFFWGENMNHQISQVDENPTAGGASLYAYG